MKCQCGARAALKGLYDSGETDLIRCGICGLVFRRKFPSASELERIYAQAYSLDCVKSGQTNQESGTFATHRMAQFLMQKGIVKKGTRVLDFGAGTGQLVALLRSNGAEALGVEFSAAARAAALDVHGLQLHASLNTVNQKFDVITCVEVIEHLTDVLGVLSALRFRLATGGCLFLTTPNIEGWRSRLERGHWTEVQKAFHLCFFAEHSLQFYVDKAGFNNVDIVRYGPVVKPGVLHWLVTRVAQTLGVAGSLVAVAHNGATSRSLSGAAGEER